MTRMTRITFAVQMAVFLMLAALAVVRTQAQVVVNVNGQTITVAAPERPADRLGAGVASNFAPLGRTGGVRRAQDMSEIMFTSE